MTQTRTERDSMGDIEVPKDRLWGAQTQRSLKYFSIGNEAMPRRLIPALALLKKACAIVNHKQKRLSQNKKDLILTACDEILEGKHSEHFPLYVWMTGSGTQVNMNVNEVVANRCSQLSGEPLGSKKPVHPNDDVNMSQSSNDVFPSAMCIASAQGLHELVFVALNRLLEALEVKSQEWKDIVKIGRTHMQDATPLTLGQEFSGYVGLLKDNRRRLEFALEDVYQLALGGTAVGTGINTYPGFAEAAAEEIARLTGLPFVTAPNKFTVQGSHDALVQLSGTLKTLAVSLYKISSDIMLLSCGPRAGFNELKIPANEPGSSIMPGKVNPTQCEALAMISLQAMANDAAVTMGGAGGYLEMNVFKPLMIYNMMQTIHILSDGMRHFTDYLVVGMEPNLAQIQTYVERSLMLVTALAPIIGYDQAAQLAYHAYQHGLSLKEAALALGVVTAEEFDCIVDPQKMVRPHQ
ncbi:MAG: class II fumarate hydratase [Chlamydiales bacterium]